MTSNRCIAGLLMVVLAAAALVTPPSIVAAPATVSAAGSRPCHTVISLALVYALRGSVYRVAPDGRDRCRLTPDVNAKEPQLASSGRFVSFLSGVGSNGSGYGAQNVVRVARVGLGPSSGTVVSSRGALHTYLAWSPDGRRLGFLDGIDVRVWSAVCHCTRLLLPGTRGTPSGSFVWSPDSRRLAAARVSNTKPLSMRLTLGIADAATGKRHVVIIRFPGWLQGNDPYHESYPSRVLGWLSRGKVLIGTSGIGVGLLLTGLWVASPAGGMAHLILGTRESPRVVLRFPLLNATQALVSPNGRRLILNPGNRLWIAPVSTRIGPLVTVGIHGSCALAQFVWMGNNGLAYVTVCTIEGRRDILARLYTLSLNSGSPRLLAAVRSPQQDTLSIAPPTGCIACG